MPIIIQKNAGGDSFPSGLKTGQNSISRAAATQKGLECYKTEILNPTGKRVSQMANPQFAFKADTNELNENALAQFLQFQNQKTKIQVTPMVNNFKQAHPTPVQQQSGTKMIGQPATNPVNAQYQLKNGPPSGKNNNGFEQRVKGSLNAS